MCRSNSCFHACSRSISMSSLLSRERNPLRDRPGFPAAKPMGRPEKASNKYWRSWYFLLVVGKAGGFVSTTPLHIETQANKIHSNADFFDFSRPEASL